MNYQEKLKAYRDFKRGRQVTPKRDDFILDTSETLKKDDLLDYKYLQPIRDYMISRKGVDYKDKDDEQVVDDFVEHMRYFNANVVSTAGEVRYVNKASKRDKEAANKAYRIYDQLGNVFVNDGLFGAVDGVFDYIKAAASDPSNYIGLITGGVAKASAVGAGIAGKSSVKAAVRKAGRDALKSGATKQQVDAAAKSAATKAMDRAVRQGYTGRSANNVYARVEERIKAEGAKAIARDAMRQKSQDLLTEAGKRSLKYTTGIDAGIAVLHDIQTQRARLAVGAQDEYSVTQSVFSSLFGGVAGGAQLAMGKFKGASGLEAAPSREFSDFVEDVIEDNRPKLNRTQTKSAVESIVKSIRTWNEKVEAGKIYDEDSLPASVIKDIVLGTTTKVYGPSGQIVKEGGYTGGILGAFKEAGYKFRANETVSDAMTNFTRYLSDDEINQINKELSKHTSIKLGELSESRVNLGDLLARKISEAGKTLNVQSQFRREVDAGLAAANDRTKASLDNIKNKEAIAEQLKEAKKSDPFRYGQNVWKRLLVSSPATTALNVAGFGQYWAGQTIADLFGATTLAIAGIGRAAVGDTIGRQKNFQQARALIAIQGQRMRNFADPYTTYDAYMRLLKKNPEIEKILFESFAGGIERSGKRFGFDPKNKTFRNIEAVTQAANTMTGVRIQDTFTKSQMFMTEIDKYLRVNKGVTLREVLNSGDSALMDDEVIGGALDTTLKSVFAKDYTTIEQPELLRSTAKFVEGISNTPFLGTILPFGRFFNNVVATTYQWSPLAAPEQFFKFAQRTAKAEKMTLNERDAFARFMVGSTGLYMAMQLDKEKREKGLAYNEVDAGGGTILDMRNMFPFSMFLAAGRVGNLMASGEEVPKELIQDMTAQLGVGQLAKDAQFANDLYNVMDVLLNPSEGARQAEAQAFAKVVGNFTSGFTRPLDAVNKVVGFATDTDTAKDIRQADGTMATFSQSATKYVDNIIEAFIDKTDTITGEDLKVATREGDVYDPNPFARIFGVTVKQGRTATEKAYSMAEMHPWTASERSKVPTYDRMFNIMLAPLLERETQKLLDSTSFQKADLAEKRRKLKDRLRKVKASLRDRMDYGYTGVDGLRLRMARKVSGYPKEIQREAARMLKDRYGLTGNPEDFEIQELDLYIDTMKLLQDRY